MTDWLFNEYDNFTSSGESQVYSKCEECMDTNGRHANWCARNQDFWDRLTREKLPKNKIYLLDPFEPFQKKKNQKRKAR